MAFLLVLSFLSYPMAKRSGKRWPPDRHLPRACHRLVHRLHVHRFQDFIYRAVTPELWDKILGWRSSYWSWKRRREAGLDHADNVIIFLAYAYFRRACLRPERTDTTSSR